MVHTIHSLKLATQLNKHCSTRKSPLKVLVQVNTSGEECNSFSFLFFSFFFISIPLKFNKAKSGIHPDNCVELVRSIMKDCSNLEFCGLMTIGEYDMSMNSGGHQQNPDFLVSFSFFLFS